jgi:phage I-like protein
VALTNEPAIDGMAKVAALKAALNIEEESESMDKRLTDALGLPEGASIEDILAKVMEMKEMKEDGMQAVLSKNPDPAQFVPFKVFDDVQKENAALREAQIIGVMESAASKLPTPELREWAQHYGQTHGASKLKARLAAMSAMPALDGKTQTEGNAPEGGKQISAVETAVLRALGLDNEAGLKAFISVKGDQ